MKKIKTGIALFVYNRPDHTKQVLAGLRENKIKKLYIFIDGIKNPLHEESVQEVKSIIYSIDWCETEIIISDKNKGLANSIIDGIKYVFENHERVIVLEDDCVPTSDFIQYMEMSLDEYEHNDSIMAVNGYKYPYEIPDEYSYDVFFTPLTTSWGWATWKKDWELFNRDENVMTLINNDKSLKQRINYINEELIGMLKMQLNGYLDSWAIFWTLIIIVNDKLCVSPVESKIINIGLDGSGVHCRNLEKYQIKNSRKKSTKNINFPSEVIIDDTIIKNTHDFFRIGFKGKIKYLIFNTIKSPKLYKFLKNYLNA